MTRLANPALAAALCLLAFPAAAFEPVAILTGMAVAPDGDDLAFGSVRVRLRGIAAPEHRQGRADPGGEEATASLSAAVAGRVITCYLDGTTAGSARRPVAVCYADGIDLGELQVRSGVALDCPRFSGGSYAAAEADAQRRGHDLSTIYERPSYCDDGG